VATTQDDHSNTALDDPGDWKDSIKDIVRFHHRSRIANWFARAAKTYLRAYYNENHYRLAYNGEGFVLDTYRRVRGTDNAVAFDVGAHFGLWASAFVERFPRGSVHCFEIAPATYETLARKVGGRAQFHTNSIGLSSQSGVLSLNYSPDWTTTTNVYSAPPLGGNVPVGKPIEVQVTTGDRYCSDRGLNRIDILKIDTEGHDLDVLNGFREMLARRPIPVIQFEFGFVHIPARNVLEDFYNLLLPFNYAVGRLHPRCVEFKDYEPREDENFRMGNYIAVHRSQEELKSALLRGK
jgi:FkbM family methyltransferase